VAASKYSKNVLSGAEVESNVESGGLRGRLIFFANILRAVLGLGLPVAKHNVPGVTFQVTRNRFMFINVRICVG
jgi:hypothetical protein